MIRIKQLLIVGVIMFTALLGIQLFTPHSAVRAIDDPLKKSCTLTEDADSRFCQNVNEGSKPILSGKNSLLMNIAQTIVFLTAGISVVMVVIGGFKYVTSNGDSGGVKSAKDTILYAVIGLFIAISAQAIVSLVLSRLVN